MNQRDYEIAKEFEEEVSKIVQLVDFRVYGSRARGNNDKYSDLDTFIEVESITKELKEKIFDIAWEIGFKYSVHISSLIFTRDEIEKSPLRVSPLVENIMTEGVRINHVYQINQPLHNSKKGTDEYIRDKEILITSRLEQAQRALSAAKKLLKGNASPRSIINRAYYSMYYAIFALFLKTDINPKTSKHIGVISIFDKEFVHTGKIDKRYSEILHRTFEAKQEADYEVLAEFSVEDAVESIKLAEEFVDGIKKELVNKK